MLFCCLLRFSLCFAFGPSVIELTDRNFRSIVDKRANNSVFMVMFHGDRCPACQQTYPYFLEASEESHGLVNFAHVDTSRQGGLAQRFQIRAIPTFMMFHAGGETVYMGNRAPRSFINSAAKLIKDYSQEVDQTWLPAEGVKSAILISSKSQTPPLWAAISSNFSDTPVKIGFTKDESIKTAFNVTKTPTIVFVKEEKVTFYKGKVAFDAVQQAIVDHFDVDFPKPSTPTPRPTPTPKSSVNEISTVESIDSFQQICKKSTKFCVFEASKAPSEQFKTLAKKFRHDPFTFVVCGSKCPLSGMDTGFWVFHSKRDVAMHTAAYDDLVMDLERIIGGNPHWVPSESLLSDNSL